MGYSLLSQFQGSLLGVSLGLFGKHLTDCSVTAETIAHAPQPLTFSPQQGHPSSANSLSFISNRLSLILSWVNSLITHKGIVWEDWEQISQAHQTLIPNNGQTFDGLPQQRCRAEIATLPLMLFFHENPCQLRQHLQQAAQLWQPQGLETTIELLALGEAIAYLLQPSANLQQLIPQILSQISPDTQLTQHLTQVSTLLQQRAGLEVVGHHLRSPAPLSRELNAHLAIAIYCFLSTPTAFSVSVRRAMRIHPDSSLTWGITAALSGAYNGLPTIPTPWRLKLSRLAKLDLVCHQSAEQSIPLDQQILNQSIQLFQIWAGLYLPIHPPTNPLTSLIVAAP